MSILRICSSRKLASLRSRNLKPRRTRSSSSHPKPRSSCSSRQTPHSPRIICAISLSQTVVFRILPKARGMSLMRVSMVTLLAEQELPLPSQGTSRLKRFTHQRRILSSNVKASPDQDIQIKLRPISSLQGATLI